MRLACRTSLYSLAAFTALAVLAPAARAQSDADRATARQLGQEGFQALDAKDYKTADDRLRRADRLVHAPTLLLGLARALAGERKFVEAQETYQRIIREGVAPGAPEAFKQAIESAKTEVSTVAPFIGRVTIAVTATGGADLPNEKVTVDDVPVNSASLGIARTIDPGEHVLVVTADGYKRAEAHFTVPDGGSVDAPVTLEKDPNYVVAPPTPPTGPGTGNIVPPPPPGGEQPPPPAPASSPSIVPWVVMGIGGVGLVTGVITGALALGDHSTLATACKGGTCPPTESGELSSYHTVGGVSTAAFIIGGVGVAAGVVLLLVQPKVSVGAPPPPTAGLHVTPVIGPGSLGAIGTF
jgi:hypothetical protein